MAVLAVRGLGTPGLHVMSADNDHSYPCKGSSSQASSSPVKVKAKLQPSPKPAQEVSETDMVLDDAWELHDSILEFPTNGQPVLYTTLKNMLVSLMSTIHVDIVSLAQQFKSDVRDVGDRVTHFEERMGEFKSTFNELIDTQQEDDLAWIRS